MNILRDPAHTEPCVLVLGFFDGVHRGHQALLMRGLAMAERLGVPLNVCTFDPHPMKVFAPERAPKLLTTLTEKARLMADFAVDNFCVMTFTRRFAAQTPEEYLESLMTVFRPRAVVCGFNFSFGDKGMGRVSHMLDWGEKNHVEIGVVPEFSLDGQRVCSTLVRQLLKDGDVRTATRCMGHCYTISGTVENGKHIGRTMGYPTANVHFPEGKALPAYGVYACWLTVEGQTWPSVVNVGRHPTLPEGSVTVEAHVLDHNPMLYGKKVRLSFLNFQRPEQTFSGVDELKARITKDAEEARAYFAKMK